MTSKKILATLFILSFLNISTFPALAETFQDVGNSYWACDAIESLSRQGIISGYADNTFRPDNYVSRAEFSTMIVKTLGAENASSNSYGNFRDLSPNFWAYNSIQKAYSMGLIKGLPDGRFKPNAYITKAEVLSILASAVNAPSLSSQQAAQVLSRFYDRSKVPGWATIPVARAVNANLAVNYPQPNFLMPQKRATRAEVAAMLSNLRTQLGFSQPTGHQHSAPPAQQNSQIEQVSQAVSGETASHVTLSGSIATLQQDSVISAKLLTPISSEISKVGDVVILTLPQNVNSNQGNVLLPAGSKVNGTVTAVTSSKFGNRDAKMTLSFNSVTLPNGRTYPLKATVATETGSIEAGSLKSKLGRGALTTIGGAGAGAVLGTALGAITGKTGKGAIYGTAIGGGLGAVGAVLAQGGAIKIPSGEPIFIKLNQPLSVDLKTGNVVSQ